MRNLKFMIALALFGLIFNNGYAQDNLSAKEKMMYANVSFGKSKLSVDVRLTMLSNALTEITIINEGGQAYYNESVCGQNGYYKWFNLENLKPGNYELIVAWKGIEHRTKILLTPQTVLENGTRSSYESPAPDFSNDLVFHTAF